MTYHTLSREEVIQAISKKIEMYMGFRDRCLRLGLMDGAREYRELAAELRWARWLLKEKENET